MTVNNSDTISPDEIEIYDEDEEVKKELSKYQVVPRIKEVIEEKGILISSIAKRLGVTPQRVYAIIKGENIPTLENAFKLVKILGVEKIEDLYEFKKIE
ncbi:MAG TPA: helix-turn-helix transcriptional regulator [Thermoanaerobacter sp.]|nr:helix-turn-helix transcriptional regulator [Thermoanaerobacter sp.]